MTSDETRCEGKNKYTQHGARIAKRYVGRRRGKDMRIYKCDICHGYHITKSKHGYSL